MLDICKRTRQWKCTECVDKAMWRSEAVLWIGDIHSGLQTAKFTMLRDCNSLAELISFVYFGLIVDWTGRMLG